MSINVRNVSKISGSYTVNPLASDLFFREKRRKGSACDAALLSAGDMSDPSPSPSHDDGLHALLVAAGQKLLVGDSLRLENTQDPSEVLCMEGGQLVQVTPSSSRISSRTVEWKVHSSGTVLVWSWCCTGMTSKRCSSFYMRFWPC